MGGKADSTKRFSHSGVSFAFMDAVVRIRFRAGNPHPAITLWWMMMARWPDSGRSNLIAGLLIFVLLPLLCWLAWVYVRP